MAKPILTNQGTLPAKAVRLHELIQDFDETLHMAWIPPESRTAFDDKPFAVVQEHPNYPRYVVMALSENELDHRVIAALFKARNVSIDDIEAEEAAKRAVALKDKLDQDAEELLFMKWAINSTRTVKHNGVTYE